MSDDLEAKIRSIIVDKLGVDEDSISDESSFTNDLGADSLDT
ncbi:MAG: phosphopantetheine-binding protein, partial [Rhodothermia bacterium]